MSFASFLNLWLRRYSSRPQKRRPFVRQKPRVEYLEDRTLLDTALARHLPVLQNSFYVPPNPTGEHFVIGLYYDVLHRQPAKWEVDYWTARVDGTASNHEVIARSFVDSV